MTTIKQLEEWLSVLQTRMQTLNERTKSHTVYIREFVKELKELRKEITQIKDDLAEPSDSSTSTCSLMGKPKEEGGG